MRIVAFIEDKELENIELKNTSFYRSYEEWEWLDKSKNNTSKGSNRFGVSHFDITSVGENTYEREEDIISIETDGVIC